MSPYDPQVAPRVGAWIETLRCMVYKIPPPSHPVWVRGLKPLKTVFYLQPCKVAPRVGAWIETKMYYFKSLYYNKSHPVWVRGLKQLVSLTMPPWEVAPRVGAWIETIKIIFYLSTILVAPRVGAWIETSRAWSASP